MDDQFGDWIQFVKGPSDQAQAEKQREQREDKQSRDSSDRSKNRRESWALGISIAAFVINFATLGIIGAQTWATKQSVDLSNRQLRIDQRAWVSLNGVGTPKSLLATESLHFGIFFKNTGKTPALDVNFEPTNWEMVDGIEHTVFKQGSPKPPGTMFPDMTSSVELVQDFTREAIDRIKQHKAVILGSGIITYSDIFGCPHWTHYCAQYVWPLGLGECDAGGDDVDRNPPCDLSSK